MLGKSKGAIKNGQSIVTGSTGHPRHRTRIIKGTRKNKKMSYTDPPSSRVLDQSSGETIAWSGLIHGITCTVCPPVDWR